MRTSIPTDKTKHFRTMEHCSRLQNWIACVSKKREHIVCCSPRLQQFQEWVLVLKKRLEQRQDVSQKNADKSSQCRNGEPRTPSSTRSNFIFPIFIGFHWQILGLVPIFWTNPNHRLYGYIIHTIQHQYIPLYVYVTHVLYCLYCTVLYCIVFVCVFAFVL